MEHSSENTHLWYIPMLLLVGSNSPLVIETFCYWFTKYRPATPLNVVFFLHRSTEIFMVLLGESVLQLITSELPNRENHPGMTVEEEQLLQEKFGSMQVMGFVLTLTVMHSFTVQEPSDDKHVLRRGGARASLWLICFVLKSLSVWLIGIGIKISLYDADAPADAFFSHDQRLQLGASCAFCYGISVLMTPLHAHTVKGYYMKLLCKPIPCVAFVIWMVNITCMLYATWWILPPCARRHAQTPRALQTRLPLTHSRPAAR